MGVMCVALLGALLAPASVVGAQNADPGLPWEAPEGASAAEANPGAGFNLTPNDLTFILQQIQISEAHALTATASNPCGTLIGDGPNQIPPGPNSEELGFGLRTVSGICNNLVPGNETFGATGEVFPRLTTPVYRDADVVTSPVDFNGPAFPNLGDTSTYLAPFAWVEDSQPRLASNLIVDQTAGNPAAAARAGGAAPDPISGDYNIENTAPDEGLSAPFNDMFTFFGQFFDHGLDLTTKSGEVVYMPLQPDDPLFVPGAPTNFMIMSRSAAEGGEALNVTSPFVDQNQTYGSFPSQQVFLREYEFSGVGLPVSTGRLLEAPVGGMSTWADLKVQAATLLGIQLSDEDVLSVPMLATDLYGRFLPGPNGFPQLVLDDSSLLEGDPTANGGLGVLVPANAVPSGAAFLVDIAHSAVPGFTNPAECPGPVMLRTPDLDPGTTDDGDCTTYDDEMLDQHFMAGDGRVNENLALTAVHVVFHAEHNRMVEDIKDVLTTQDPASVPLWQLGPGTWNGEYLFQAAKFVTEMEYQHLVFEEFGRKVQPNINVFAGYDSTIDPAITVEFSQAIYRFGHSMLNNTVTRFNADGTPNDISLFDAFLNPPEFLADYPGNPADAAGAIFRGGTSVVGQEIDEFVVDALRNTLVGLPLDLAAINMARGREAGVAPLNEIRRQLYVQTNNDTSLRPYDNWVEFGLELRGSESLVNFIAAYGTHAFITTYDDGGALTAGSSAARRAAAQLMVDNDLAAPTDTFEFMTSTGGTWGTPSGTTTNTGVDDIDLWVGAIAERPELFGGLLGSTANYIFELQLERLQDGDRFYYLSRLAGTDMLSQLEGNSFAELIERVTTAENLPADVFSVPTYFFDAGFQGTSGPIVDDPATVYNEETLLLRMPDGTIRYTGVEHVNFAGGDTIPDKITSGEGDDTVRGNGGDDRLEGDGGNDVLIGGLGDDILTDSFGEDDLKGGPGNDALQGGPFFDLLQGGSGDDFAVSGSDTSETFGGIGDDVIFGGAAATIIFGGDGNDWMEGSDQADLILGGNGNPFQTDPEAGNDVILGGAGADDLDAEGGDDIFVAGAGANRFEGMIGYDWVIHYNDPQAVESDLVQTGLLPPTVDPFADRFDLVEGLSGWDGDDTLRGDTAAFDIADLGGNVLDPEGIALLPGIEDILPPGTIAFDGNILLGGAGSDTIEGRGDDDIIDGDRWLRVQLEAPLPGGGLQRVDRMSALTADVFAGLINPGSIDIVREIVTALPGSDVDVAEYAGPQADYNITDLGDRVIVAHVRGCGDPAGLDACPALPDGTAGIPEGTDTLFNMETLQFSDGTVDISAPPVSGLLRVTTTPALPGQIVVDGFIRDTWGLTWPEIPVGSREVCFTDLSGFSTPGCQTVQVDEGMTTTVDGAYTQTGWLQVQTNPAVPGTITVDGNPANDWGMWTDMAPGDYLVCYGAVAGFDAPPCETATVVAGATTMLVGDYIDNVAAAGPTGFGLLRVTTTPAVPAQITLDGVISDRWALTWVKLAPGAVEVCFGDVPGFTTPGCQVVTIVEGATTVVSGDFIERGTLRVTTTPAAPSTISVDGIARNAWGVWTDFAPGTYEVCWGDTPGLTAPPCETVVVTAGATTTVNGSFL